MPSRFRELLKRIGPLVAAVRALRAVRRACRPPLRRLSSRFTRRERIAAYLRDHPVARLHLGCGRHGLPGWLNSDYDPAARGAVLLDVTRAFPLPNGSFERVFSEHLIEHLSFADGARMLRECYRVLKPGGRIRVATPNLEAYLGLFAGEPGALGRHYLEWFTAKYLSEVPVPRPAHVLNVAVRHWGHRFLYDRATLTDALERAGFVKVLPCAPGRSDDELFAGVDSHGKTVGDEGVNEFETLVLEADRPI